MEMDFARLEFATVSQTMNMQLIVHCVDVSPLFIIYLLVETGPKLNHFLVNILK
jgi:hypothetical protein